MVPLLAETLRTPPGDRYVVLISYEDGQYAAIDSQGRTWTLDEEVVHVIGPAADGWHAAHGASASYGFSSDL